MPMTEAACSSRLSSGGSRSMRAARIACTVAGTWSASTGRVSRYAPRSPASAPVSTSVRTRLLEEERVALRPLDQEPLERREARVGAEQRRQQLARALGAAAGRAGAGGSSVLLPQRVLVLGPVVDEEQQARRAAGSRPGCRAGPGSRRRSSAGPRRPASSGCTWLSRSSSRLTASRVRWRRCGRVQGLPGGVLDRHVEQRQQRPAASARARGPASSSLPVTFSRISRWSSRSLDLEVALEQVDHGQVAGGLAVGDRGALEDQPALGPMGVGELVDEARLAHARLAHDGDHLAVARAAPARGAGGAAPSRRRGRRSA